MRTARMLALAHVSMAAVAHQPNHPEYPGAHACHTSAIVEALGTFFGTDDVPVTLDSRTTGTTERFNRLHEIVRDVEDARVFAGFHFRNSNVAGSRLGRDVARFVAARYFLPLADSDPRQDPDEPFTLPSHSRLGATVSSHR